MLNKTPQKHLHNHQTTRFSPYRNPTKDHKRLLSIFFPGVLAKQQGSLCTNTKSYSQISTRNRIYRHTHTCKDAEEIQRIILEGRKDFGKVS